MVRRNYPSSGQLVCYVQQCLCGWHSPKDDIKKQAGKVLKLGNISTLWRCNIPVAASLAMLTRTVRGSFLFFLTKMWYREPRGQNSSTRAKFSPFPVLSKPILSLKKKEGREQFSDAIPLVTAPIKCTMLGWLERCCIIWASFRNSPSTCSSVSSSLTWSKVFTATVAPWYWALKTMSRQVAVRLL